MENYFLLRAKTEHFKYSTISVEKTFVKTFETCTENNWFLLPHQFLPLSSSSNICLFYPAILPLCMLWLPWLVCLAYSMHQFLLNWSNYGWMFMIHVFPRFQNRHCYDFHWWWCELYYCAKAKFQTSLFFPGQ